VFFVAFVVTSKSAALPNKEARTKTLVIAADPVPLRTDESGVIRVGDTRVTLDTIVEKFQQGATVEDLARKFPSVKLAHLYAVIAYYLEHQAEVDVYLHQHELEAEQVQREAEARFDVVSLRKRVRTYQATQDAESG
jgi:uncharacterized protein (DUF433 family)